MNKTIIILTCFLGLASSAYSFPNLQNYEHEYSNKGKNIEYFCTPTGKEIPLAYVKYEDYDAIRGQCASTGCIINIVEVDGKFKCLVFDGEDHKKYELSTSTTQQTLDGMGFLCFDFGEGPKGPHGRVLVYRENEDNYRAILFSWPE